LNEEIKDIMFELDLNLNKICLVLFTFTSIKGMNKKKIKKKQIIEY
jgi:hypothetical protein